MSEPIRAVDRALDILTCFSRDVPRLSMSQIAEQVGMNKSTVHRMLGTLEKKRFIQRDEATGLYQLGIRPFQMAYLALEQSNLRRQALPFMQSLCSRFRETTNLSVMEGSDILFLDVIESPQRVKLAASIGQRAPAFCTASGKAMLSRLPKEGLSSFLGEALKPVTKNSITDPEAFLENLGASSRQGFAISLQEYEDGINAVAAPILDRRQYPVAAISVAGPSYRLTLEKMQEIGPFVAESTRSISLKLK